MSPSFFLIFNLHALTILPLQAQNLTPIIKLNYLQWVRKFILGYRSWPNDTWLGSQIHFRKTIQKLWIILHA